MGVLLRMAVASGAALAAKMGFAVVAAFLALGAASAEWRDPPADYVYTPLKECPLPTRIYNACEDQVRRFLDAAEKARREGRMLLVVFGADWCPDCHRLDKLLPTRDVLGHDDLAGRLDVVTIAVSVVVDGRLIDIWGGVHVLRQIAAKAGKRERIKGIPYAAVVDPKSEDRTVVFPTTNLEYGDDRPGHDPEKVRATLLDAMARLGG